MSAQKKIGLPVLFIRSENILDGKLDATKDEVYSAAKNAVIKKLFNKKEMKTKKDHKKVLSIEFKFDNYSFL